MLLWGGFLTLNPFIAPPTALSFTPLLMANGIQDMTCTSCSQALLNFCCESMTS